MAISELQTLVALEPENPDTQENLGVLLFFAATMQEPLRICALLRSLNCGRFRRCAGFFMETVSPSGVTLLIPFFGMIRIGAVEKN